MERAIALTKMILENSSDRSYLEEYAEKILSGEIIANYWIKRQYEQLIHDIDSGEYIFDLKEAHKRIKFIETKCKHTKSPFAGKPVMLELWEKAAIEAVYGFYINDEETGELIRRFTYMLLFIPRKNGKSTLAAALGNAEFFCGNWGTVIFCASNDYDQADIVFNEIDNMRDLSPSLARVTRRNNTGIFFGNRKQHRTVGKISKQNKAEIRKISARKKGKEGRNIDLAIVDESHEMENEDLIKPLKQSMSTKNNCLMIEITSEGTVEEGHLDKVLTKAKETVKGEREDPRSLYLLYTQDNEQEIWINEDTWIKSNPNLGVSKKRRFLRDEINEAKEDAAARSWMLCKDFNLKQNSANAWLDPSIIANDETFKLEDFSGQMYIAGVDLAATTDLSAFSALFKVGKDFFLHQHFWIPSAKLEARDDSRAGADYLEWARQGWLTIVDDVDVDSAVVADYQWELYETYRVLPFKGGYDNRFAKSYLQRHEELFGKDILENVPQDAKALSNAMNNTAEHLKMKLINYQNNPVTAWCFRNCSYKMDSIGRIMPKRIRSDMKIDGVASCLDAMFSYQAHRSEYTSLIS